MSGSKFVYIVGRPRTLAEQAQHEAAWIGDRNYDHACALFVGPDIPPGWYHARDAFWWREEDKRRKFTASVMD